MRQYHWKPFVLGIVALALSTVDLSNLHAQPPPDDQGDHSEQGPAADHVAHPPAQPDERQSGDAVARYRQAHPGAAARCHDGFFTKTKDRKRACSKHGGIDIWLLP